MRIGCRIGSYRVEGAACDGCLEQDISSGEEDDDSRAPLTFCEGLLAATPPRRTLLPVSVFGLAIAITVDKAVGQVHELTIWMMMGVTVIIQAVLVWFLHDVTDTMVRNGEGCNPSNMLQWCCIFVYSTIIWYEISVSLDTLEWIVHVDEGRQLLTHTKPITPFQLYTDALHEEDLDWQHVDGVRSIGYSDGISNPDESWQWCDTAKCWSDEHGLYRRQDTGFKLQGVSRLRRACLIGFVVLPKLILEVFLLLVGSSYIAVSTNNEEVINSVVAMTFIATIDEAVILGLVPDRIVRALLCTKAVEYVPETGCGAVWVRIRTAWRPFIDPVIVAAITHYSLNVALSHAGCDTYGSPERV